MTIDPDDADLDGGDLSIDIDPELIAAAMTAVDARAKKKKKRTFAPSRMQEETGDPVTVDLEFEARQSEAAADDFSVDDIEVVPQPRTAPRTPLPKPVATVDAALDERARLAELRVRELTERLRRAEAELARAEEAKTELDRQVRELRDAAVRIQADADSARVRSRKDREEAERGAEDRVLRGLVDIVENVERGIQFAGQDPTRVLAGLNMIAEQFRALLKRVGVERIPADPGILFDPALHEALLHLPTADTLPGCIVNEVAAGFLLRGRLMRPARVVVASAPADSE